MRKYIALCSLVALLAGIQIDPLAAQSTARLQVIHNAADPSAAVVDVYAGSTLLLDDFAFRAATPFIDVPAGVQIDLGIAPPTSSSSNDAIAVIPVTFDAGKTYVAVANGVLDPSAFAANPDARSIAFQLFSTAMGLESSPNSGTVALAALHGATDAPAVDVIARGVATLVNNAAYGDITPYFEVPAAPYVLDVTPTGVPVIVASFDADLSGLAGGAAVVFASGFLNPVDNNNGAAFGLFAALPNGTVVELPLHTPGTARLQVIHNAADPSAATVDVYVNDALAIGNFAFRTATPFLEFEAGVEFEIGIAPGNSTSSSEILARFPITLGAGGRFVAIANGVLDPSRFAANPGGGSTGFTLYITEQPQDDIPSTGVELAVFHGATDAPAVDVIARGVGSLVEDLAYGQFTPWFEVPTGDYTLDITPASSSNVVASFRADLTALGGASAVVFASGFLAPDGNQGGAGFGLFAALESGQVVPLGSVTTVERVDAAAPALQLNAYPNPSRGSTTVNFALDRPASALVKVYDLAGREVLSALRGDFASGSYNAVINTSTLAPGLYNVVLYTPAGVTATPLAVVR